MNETVYPVVDGVRTLVGAPAGYHVDFANPQQHYKLAHYLIVGLVCPLAIITLGQRLYTKLYLSTGLKLDDALICTAWLFSLVMQSAQIWSIAIGGLCHHAWEMPLDVFKKNMITAYIAGPTFILCNGLSKMSLLAYYSQLSPHRYFRIAIWATCGMVGCYTIILAAFMLFGCYPIRTFWDPEVVSGHCVDFHILYMAIAVSNIVSDVVLLIIPLPTLYKLNLGRVKKIGAMMFFGVASLTIATSVIRLLDLPILATTKDVTWDAAHPSIWAFLEVNLVIICGTMPTLRKFFMHFTPRLMRGTRHDGPADLRKTSPRYFGGSPSLSASSHRGLPLGRSAHYEQFDDTAELASFAHLSRGDRAAAGYQVNTTAGGVHAQNLSDKAILQTRTVDIEYEES